jgi:flagellar basal body-associated protein FliL
MSEETNDGSWSGLKKTIIGTLTTLITGGGVYMGTLLYGGGEDDKEETKTDQPAAAPVVINVQQNQENKQKVENSQPSVIRERIIEKEAAPTKEKSEPKSKPEKTEEESW